MATHYPIRAVAKLTGISPDTLRAWERRYKAVSPVRTGRGRQYGHADIERLRRLNRLVQGGHAIGSIAGLTDDQLDALHDKPASHRPSAPAKANDLLHTVLTAIEAFDTTRASDELTRLASVLAPREFVYQVVLPLMHEVGVRWHDGRLSVAQEHLVSQMLRNLLGSLMRLFRPAAPARRMVAATPAGETHEFGVLAASMLAAIGGIDVVYLGADLPANETGRAARLVSAPVVLFGITVVTDRTLEEIKSVARAMPEKATLWLGGAGMSALDLSEVERPTVVLSDLPAFEHACLRWRF